MNKKTLTALVVTGIVAGGLLIPFSASAADETKENTFIQKLAEKLGVDESKVETAMDSVKEEMHAERLAELKEEIKQAVTDGKLTQRQADILLAMEGAREALKPEEGTEKPDLSEMTEEERKAFMEEKRSEMQQKMVDYLNEKGLDTNTEELESTMKAARDAEIRIGFGGKRGPGGHGGRMGGPRGGMRDAGEVEAK